MLLKAQRVSQAQIARDLGEAESTVSRVIAGTYTSSTTKGRERRDRIERHIAALLQVPVESIFPREDRGEASGGGPAGRRRPRPTPPS
jgi:transcriptional regulator with XRE-family HTH domain